MGRRWGLALLLFVMGGMGFTSASWAYTPTVTPQGKGVRWGGQARLPLAGNPKNRSGLTESEVYQAVVRGLQRWKAAAMGTVAFEYWQGTDRSIYEPSSDYNGLSSLYFASNAAGSTGLASNVLGLTQVWYNTDSGQILEADIVLNDLNYRFTTNPKDTSGYGSIESASGGRNVFIENVLTHELGHAFGLSHSGGLQSTMLFMESPEQAYLSCDEQVAIRTLYPNGNTGPRGALSGNVVMEGSNAPVFGAHVLAISRRRGTVLASTLTDRAGRYTFTSLEPGTYFILAEPYYAGSSALPSFYSGLSNALCNGRAYSRTLLTGGGSVPTPIAVPAGGGASAPFLTLRCSSSGQAGAAVSAVSGASSFSSAPVVFTGGTDSGFGYVDRIDSSQSAFYRLNSLSGRIELRALSYSLYSPVRPSLTLFDSAGNPVPSSQVSDRVYIGNSGYVNYDSALIADNLAQGNYVLRVSAAGMSSSLYPVGPLALDSAPFVLLSGSLNEAPPAAAATLPFNARCRMDENFSSYTSPPGNPERQSVDSREDSAGFCGTIQKVAEAPGPKQSNRWGGDPKGGSGSAGAIAGWFVPWILMGWVARRARRWGSARL